MTASSDPVPEDCVACGACCFSREPRYLRVSGSDHERLGDDAEALTAWIEHRVYLRIVNAGLASRCAALQIGTDERGAGRYTCRVYERRPEVCRQLERGSAECAAERAAKGDRPDAARRTTNPGTEGAADVEFGGALPD